MSLAATSSTASLKALSAPHAEPRSAFLAVVLGWLLPGLGQFYVGRPGRGFVMLVAIGGLFYAGLWMTGFTCVNPDTYSLEFVAHAFLGGPTAAAYYAAHDLALTEPLPWFEAGRLYAAVAGLLNIVAICDALGEVISHNDRVRAQAELRRRFLAQRQRELDAMIAAREEAEAPEPEPEVEAEPVSAFEMLEPVEGDEPPEPDGGDDDATEERRA